jgi:hypothetical protein
MKKVKQRHAPRRKPVLKGRAAREREEYRLALARERKEHRLALARNNAVIDKRDRQEEEVFLASIANAPPMMPVG